MEKKSHIGFGVTARLLPFVVALATATANTASSFLPICITCIKRVSVLTVGLFLVLYAQSVAAKHVFARGDEFNVGGVHTSPVSAKMVTNQMVGHEFNKHSVNQSVGELGSDSDNTRDAVAINVFSGSPFPTRNVIEKVDSGYLNLRKEAGKNCAIDGNTVRIVEGHFSLLNRLNLARVIKGLITFGSPFSILAQVTFRK